MKKEIYNILKYLQRLALPALATLYLTLAGIWSLPYGEQISATIMAVDVFLGVLLGLTKASCNRAVRDTLAALTDDKEEETE